MGEGQQFHIPVTPMSIEKLTAGLLECDNVRKKKNRKTSYMRQKKELTFGKMSQSPLQDVYGGAQTHVSPTRT